jgi:hypothetical protein
MERFRRRQQGALAEDVPLAPAHGTNGRDEERQPESSRIPDADVQVIYGASVQSLPFAGLPVAEARRLAQSILRVEARSPVLVNGRPARAESVLARGDVLEFVHYAGEKGAPDEFPDRDR